MEYRVYFADGCRHNNIHMNISQGKFYNDNTQRVFKYLTKLQTGILEMIFTLGYVLSTQSLCKLLKDKKNLKIAELGPKFRNPILAIYIASRTIDYMHATQGHH